MTGVTLEKVVKRYGDVQVIHGVDLQVEDGEFCVFVGPSGCGKSTLLRMIAVLEETTGGTVRIGALDRPANFWLQPQRIPLDDGPDGPQASAIELSGLYDLGVRAEPLLTSWRSGGRLAGVLAWIPGELVARATG